MEREYLIFQLGLELGEHTGPTAPSGWLIASDRPPRRFESYVQLIGALEELRAKAALERKAEAEAEPCARPRPRP